MQPVDAICRLERRGRPERGSSGLTHDVNYLLTFDAFEAVDLSAIADCGMLGCPWSGVVNGDTHS